jgi:hypothetical protein
MLLPDEYKTLGVTLLTFLSLSGGFFFSYLSLSTALLLPYLSDVVVSGCARWILLICFI